MKGVPLTLMLLLWMLLLWTKESTAFPSKTTFTSSWPRHSRLAYKETSLINDSSLLSGMKDQDRILPSNKMECKTILRGRPANERILDKAMSIYRRLDTAEDKFDCHKVSSIVYLAATFQILLTGGVNGFTSIPTSLQASTYCFLATSIVQGATSMDMALKYRKKDPIVRAGFVNMSCNMLSLGWAAVIGSPFLPEGISERMATEIMLVSLLPVFFFTSNEIFTIQKRVQNRKRRRNEKGGDLGATGDVFSYVFTTVAGCIAAFSGIVILSDPSHDYKWLEDTFGTGDGMVGIHSYYSGVVTSLSVAIGALSITLRDRKIIGKQSEQLLIGVPTTIFVLVQLKALNIV